MPLELPCKYKSPHSRCVVRVDDCWYDLTTWRHAHPGGAQILDLYDGRDATDAFYALHSEDAIAKLKRMSGRPIGAADPPRAALSIAYEAFRAQLTQQGKFRRQLSFELVKLTIAYTLIAAGILVSGWSYLLSSLLVAVGVQQVSWMAHDYAHMRGRSSYVMSIICSATVGISRGWWSNKHNTHHAFPNRVDIDSDIHNEPLLFLWRPSKRLDAWWRRYQHFYYLLLFALLHVSWRRQSIHYAIISRNTTERIAIAVGTLWPFMLLPPSVVVASILICGFLVALVVTANHQSEDMLPTDGSYHFVGDQFRTTRGVVCNNFITEYLFGGMQYQLEHHLFPTMPRCHYPTVRPLVRAFAKANGLPYKLSDVSTILQLNYNVMRSVAHA